MLKPAWYTVDGKRKKTKVNLKLWAEDWRKSLLPPEEIDPSFNHAVSVEETETMCVVVTAQNHVLKMELIP